ncbi:9424_t:CDS:2, partial [Dentiscutata erythropus]
ENGTKWYIPDSFKNEDLLNLSNRIDVYIEEPFVPAEEEKTTKKITAKTTTVKTTAEKTTAKTTKTKTTKT